VKFNKKQTIKFQRLLMNWYKRHQRKLPWRDTSNPYYIWVSEVMLQQTQVNTVIPYYERFILQFPTIKNLATSSLQKVLKSWEGLGYYSRARNFHKASKQIETLFNGNIPDQPSLFKKLPGVGDYICAAVQSIAFQHPLAVVDGNVKRLISRIFKINTPINSSTSYKMFKKKSEQLLLISNPGVFNQAMMELGAIICKSSQPICKNCPVKSLCLSFQDDVAHNYPKRLAIKSIPVYHISTAIIRKNSRLLITQRDHNGLLGGLWEFPGGKVLQNEDSKKACKREVKEEVNLNIKVDKHLAQVKHAYSHFKITMDVYLCTYVSGKIKLNGPVDYKWIYPSKIINYPLPKANHKFLPNLYNELSIKEVA
jgi:A/G-specific adenine glycosylase